MSYIEDYILDDPHGLYHDRWGSKQGQIDAATEPCDCGGSPVLRQNKTTSQYFYGCSNWRASGCSRTRPYYEMSGVPRSVPVPFGLTLKDLISWLGKLPDDAKLTSGSCWAVEWTDK